jgi:hypothetical protein
MISQQREEIAKLREAAAAQNQKIKLLLARSVRESEQKELRGYL